MSSPSFVLTAVGDALLVHPITPCMTEPAYAAVLDLLRGADAAIANCEVSAFAPTLDGPAPQNEAGGLWLNADPAALSDLMALGITLVSRANNHATDFGVDGMTETDRLLTQLGIAHAGTGETLAAARAPAYRTTRAGRIALMSATDTGPRSSMAGHARPDMRGRPGVNLLRARQTRVLDEVTFMALLGACDLAARQGGALAELSPDGTTLHGLGAPIRKGTAIDDVFELFPQDVAGNLDQVRAARRRADLVVFALHSHLSHGPAATPPQAIQDFARATIDAGADIIVGHGTHRLGPIEIHQGRPICYGLGNFVCHLSKVDVQPADLFEGVGIDVFHSQADDLLAESLHTARALDAPSMWESVVVRLIQDERGRRLELHPIDLGRGASGAALGTPRLAAAADAARIIDEVAALSSAFGTRIANRDGVGVIELGPAVPHEVGPRL